MIPVRIYATRCAHWWTAVRHRLTTPQRPINTIRWLSRHQNHTSPTYTRWTHTVNGVPLFACTRHFSENQHDSVPKRPARAELLGILVQELLQGPANPTREEWLTVEENVTSLLPNAKQWPSVVMKMFSGRYRDCEQESAKRITLAKSLLEFTRHSGGGCTDRRKLQVTVALLTSYMTICGHHLTFLKTQDTEAEAHLMAIFNEVKQKTRVYDHDSSIAIIEALCNSKGLWRQSLDVLDVVKDVYPLSVSQLNPIITAAYREGSLDVAERLLPELAELLPGNTGFTAVLDDRLVGAILDKAQKDGHSGIILDLLQRMKEYRWLLSATITTQFINYYKSIPTERWTGSVTSVTADGVCNSCGHSLESEELTSQQFESLRASFMQRCLQREDIFLNTSPQELQRFQSFLKNQPAFDIVLDGLNIALMTRSKIPYHQALNLLDVVTDFSTTGRLLVCGRMHMQTWPKKVMARIQKLATVFFTENISSDDPFMLYAAFHSGPHTLLVTHDMLRDHRILLPPEHRHNFNTWQRTHQIDLSRRIGHGPSYYWPSRHDTRVQWTVDRCHVPFEDQSERASHEQPTSWVCLQKEN